MLFPPVTITVLWYCWSTVLNSHFHMRKIATLLKPDKDITQDGDHFIIKTLSTFRNYNMDFVVGQEFEEDLSGVDDRKCMTIITWDGDKLVCVQKGEIEGRGWTHWIEEDELHLEVRCRWWGKSYSQISKLSAL
uniref:Retinol-binding protein 1-like n=1 Tax=Sinocyclocheilus rhinocerous TaxID=307959 RepID=A0A673ICZ0_9TELE